MANNAAPDVRYRLSAEGLADVISAFKKVQAESDKTKKAGAGAGGAIGQLMGNLGGLKSLIPTITVAGIITGFVAMTKGALDAAAAIGKMNQRTGISVETLSVISYAAQKTGSDIETVEKGFIKFDKAMGQLDNNSKATRDSIAALLGSADALNGLNTDERLKKVIDALAAMEPSYKRTAMAQELFGRGGAMLLPVMDKLGGEGFAKLRDEAEKVGLMYDKNFVQAARQAKAGMRQLQLEAKGMATQFAAGLVPAIVDAGAALVDATGGDGVNGFRTLGEFAGNVIKTLISAIVKIALNATWVFGRVASLGTRTFQLLSDAAHGRFKGSWDAFKQGIINDSTALDKTLQDRFDKFQASMNGAKRLKPEPEPVADETDYSYKPDEGAIEKARRAALALAEANQDAAARVAAAELKQREANEKEKYEQGLESLNEYYQARIQMTREQAQKEEAALYQKIQNLQNAPLGKDESQDERQAEIVKTSADYQVKVLENAAALQNLEAERAKEMEALEQKALEFESKIQKVQGDRYRAAKADIDAQAAALDKLLAKQGVAPAQRAQRVEAYRQDGYQKIDFGQLQNDGQKAIKEIENAQADVNRQAQQGQLTELERQRQIYDLDQQRLPVLREIARAMAESAITEDQVQAAQDFQAQIEGLAFNSQRDRGSQALQDLDRARQEIQRKVQEGQLYEFQGEDLIRQLEIQRLPLLQKIADAMKGTAITDEQRQAAQDFQAQIDALATSTNKAAQEMATFKQDVQGALTSDLANFFTSGIDGAESMGDAFRGLASSVVNSLRQIAAQMLANLLMQKMLGLFAGAATGGAAPAGGGGVGMATGGLLRGPGTGTSDSIPIRASNWEYVVRSSVVKRPGMLAFLNKLNFGTPRVRTSGEQRFRDGGLVDVAASGKGGQAALTAVLALDEGLLLKRLEASPEFSRLYVRTAQSNQKAMKNAIGG